MKIWITNIIILTTLSGCLGKKSNNRGNVLHHGTLQDQQQSDNDQTPDTLEQDMTPVLEDAYALIDIAKQEHHKGADHVEKWHRIEKGLNGEPGGMSLSELRAFKKGAAGTSLESRWILIEKAYLELGRDATVSIWSSDQDSSDETLDSEDDWTYWQSELIKYAPRREMNYGKNIRRQPDKKKLFGYRLLAKASIPIDWLLDEDARKFMFREFSIHFYHAGGIPQTGPVSSRASLDFIDQIEDKYDIKMPCARLATISQLKGYASGIMGRYGESKAQKKARQDRSIAQLNARGISWSDYGTSALMKASKCVEANYAKYLD